MWLLVPITKSNILKTAKVLWKFTAEEIMNMEKKKMPVQELKSPLVPNFLV